MAVIRQAQARRMSGEAIVLNLGDLSRQAESLLSRARAQAQAIIEQAQRERREIIEGAERAGHAQGLERGLQEGTPQGVQQGAARAFEELAPRLSALDEAWTQTLEQFQRDRDAIHQDARDNIVRVAMLLAQAVVKRAVTTDPSLVREQVEAVLRLVGNRTHLTLILNPQDESIVRRALPRMAGIGGADVALVTDAAVSRGSCIARTIGGGEVDASIETQLRRIAEVLVPGGGEL